MTTTTLPVRPATAVPLPTCGRCRQGVRSVTLTRGLLLCDICQLIAKVRARLR